VRRRERRRMYSGVKDNVSGGLGKAKGSAFGCAECGGGCRNWEKNAKSCNKKKKEWTAQKKNRLQGEKIGYRTINFAEGDRGSPIIIMKSRKRGGSASMVRIITPP